MYPKDTRVLTPHASEGRADANTKAHINVGFFVGISCGGVAAMQPPIR
jgi:hypothetical protein